MPIPTSQSGADEQAHGKPEDPAMKQREQSKAALENISEDFDGGSGVGDLKPEAGETRVIGQSDPTGSRR
ncbi:hypothetical protein MW290_08480 [Aquincola tertiaricarbonis]|uniref:Uncharacterized protein n=1 Tax=Aquincola tertiaricarbonis TaxID=391953 RepID=A0ABY4RZU3_AQUTE|nr:hypothetical protein [Aquincola tertiaricarbonis]URI05974.1 hypothetical protein MW290_08480 [Aquincola tertiaricarbonis]